MKRKVSQVPATPYEVIQDHVIRSLGQSLEVFLDSLTTDDPVTIGQVLFDHNSMSLSLRWPFLLSGASGDLWDSLRIASSQSEFRKGLRKHLKGFDARRHLSSALYGELRAFTILFIQARRWGERVVDGLNSVGERRMAGRRKIRAIEKLEGKKILRQAQMIQSTISEISKRAKSMKSRGPALRKKILKDYGRDQYPWIRSLFPALQDLHGRPTLDNLDTRTTRKLVAAIIQTESYRETGTLHSLGAIDQVLRRE